MLALHGMLTMHRSTCQARDDGVRVVDKTCIVTSTFIERSKHDRCH